MKKLVLILLRFVPIIGALCCASNSILSYFGFDLVWLGYVMHGLMMATWIALAVYFQFCLFYKILVLYILACEVINTIDYVFTIPISNWSMFVIYCGLAGITVITATIAHVRDKGKHKDNT